ncbi:MAG: KpsF/GutQ family sugar-phosphate isomerase [Alphaproteobacteria bacterium]|nr:KpsF/GutQ family sugar-phosphate isomerase [Alphaproteobacteria bacterium]
MQRFREIGLRVIEEEIRAINLLAHNLPKDFEGAVSAITSMEGNLIVSGIGKSGHVGQKIAASFTSTGTRSFYLHPSEASHGDLGIIAKGDVVLILSNSGDTKEIKDIISYCRNYNIPIIGITSEANSLLGKNSHYLLSIPQVAEASNLRAPTSSTILMMVLGDALVVSVHESKGFSEDEFGIFHPGGKLGEDLIQVGDIMHKDSEVPSVIIGTKMQDAILEMTTKKFGCTAVLDNNKLVGIITDGDLRKNMSSTLLEKRVEDIMTNNPITITQEVKAKDAVSLMKAQKVSSLLVTEESLLLGIVHIHDLLKR